MLSRIANYKNVCDINKTLYISDSGKGKGMDQLSPPPFLHGRHNAFFLSS